MPQIRPDGPEPVPPPGRGAASRQACILIWNGPACVDSGMNAENRQACPQGIAGGHPGNLDARKIAATTTTWEGGLERGEWPRDEFGRQNALPELGPSTGVAPPPHRPFPAAWLMLRMPKSRLESLAIPLREHSSVVPSGCGELPPPPPKCVQYACRAEAYRSVQMSIARVFECWKRPHAHGQRCPIFPRICRTGFG